MRITAMVSFVFVLAVGAGVTASVIALVRAVSSDGYGWRPGPRSHCDSFPS